MFKVQNVQNQQMQDLKMQEQTKKKRSQTLRDGCSKAEPKIFAPPQTRFLGRGYGMV